MLLFLLLLFSSFLNSSLSLSISTGSSNLPDLDAAVLVPGFLTGESDFREMAHTLGEQGVPTVVVPMPAWHWIPCLGGRSVRPILERIDFTVRHVAAGQEVPNYDYSILDCWQDFQANPGGLLKAGGSDKPEEYPTVGPKGNFPEAGPPKGKIALIGHSAGGWISRIYLSNREYGGKAYEGHSLVHSLVTLGTPNGNAPGPAFEGIAWCNREEPNDALPRLRKLAVGGIGFRGNEWGSFTEGAYSFCCEEGSDVAQCDGDGVTPIDSSLTLPNSEAMEIEGAHHFCWADLFVSNLVSPKLTRDHAAHGRWYGSSDIAAKWIQWLLQR